MNRSSAKTFLLGMVAMFVILVLWSNITFTWTGWRVVKTAEQEALVAVPQIASSAPVAAPQPKPVKAKVVAARKMEPQVSSEEMQRKNDPNCHPVITQEGWSSYECVTRGQ